jgi:hypothetical protein
MAALSLRQAAAASAALPAPRAGGEASASFFSQVLYLWTNPLFTKANTPGATLEERDLLPLSPEDAPAAVSARFEELLRKHTALKAANPVTSALWEQFSAPMIAAGWRA